MILGVGLSARDLPQQTFEIAVCRDQDEVVSGGVLQNPPNRRHEQARFGTRFRSQRSNSRPKTSAVMPLTAIAPEYRSGIMAGLATPVFWKWCSVAFQAAMPPFVGHSSSSASSCRKPLVPHIPALGERVFAHYMSDGQKQAAVAGQIERQIRPLPVVAVGRSEEHTSELQSLRHLVCRLLLEKKKH